MDLTLIGQLAMNKEICLRMVLCFFNLFLNRKLSVSEKFQFNIINLSHQVGQIEQCYEDGNCFKICLFIKGLFFPV